MKKIKIVAIGDINKTGLGRAICEPLCYLAETGKYEIIQLALGHTGWARYINKEEYPYDLIPMRQSKWGRDILPDILTIEKPDILFTMADWSHFDFISCPSEQNKVEYQLYHPANRKFKHLMYFPLDGLTFRDEPMQDVVDVTYQADIPVNCAPFSYDVLKKYIPHLHYIPHGIDTNLWKPVPKNRARAAMDLPQDKFIIGMVGTNQIRKQFEDLFHAFSIFVENKDDVLLLPFTQFIAPEYEGSHNLEDLALRLHIENKIINPEPKLGCPHELMNVIYNCMDVHTLLSLGEGFGYPAVEARACGVPSLVSNHTACGDFVAHEFERIDNRASFIGRMNNIIRFLPDIGHIVSKWEELYLDWKKDKMFITMLGKTGMDYVKNNLDSVKIFPEWDKLITAEVEKGVLV